MIRKDKLSGVSREPGRSNSYSHFTRQVHIYPLSYTTIYNMHNTPHPLQKPHTFQQTSSPSELIN